MPWTPRLTTAGLFIGALAAGALGFACGDPGPENAGSPCVGPADCYENVAHEDLAGEVVCVDKVEYGYCTHDCQSDADCCAIPGECRTGVLQVCSPFENTDTKRCFLSCEAADLAPGYEGEPDRYCSEYMFADWTCASSGGGSENRKICKP